MLTKDQYTVLCKYRDSTVPVTKPLDDMTGYFLERKFISPGTFEYTVREECAVTYQKSVWLLTLPGKLAIEEYEEHQAQLYEQRIWLVVSTTIGLLTLATTVLFGILGLLR